MPNDLGTGWAAGDDVEPSRVSDPVVNVAPNPGFEGTLGWTQVGDSDFPATSFFPVDAGHGSRSGKVARVVSNEAKGCLEADLAVGIQANFR